MTVIEFGGASTTSGVLDANPGVAFNTVEGFIGVTSATGITSVTINSVQAPPVFEVDHLQIAGALIGVNIDTKSGGDPRDSSSNGPAGHMPLWVY